MRLTQEYVGACPGHYGITINFLLLLLPLHTPTEKNSTTVPAETCQDQLIYMGFGVGIGGLIIGLVLGTIIATTLCIFSGSCSGSSTKKPEIVGLGEK